MSHDMFGEVVHRSVRLGSRRWYTVPLSITAHAAVVAVLIVAPLMAADVLPTPTTVLSFVAAAPTPPPPPFAPAPRSIASKAHVNDDAAPVVADDKIVSEEPIPAVSNPGPAVEGGLPSGLAGGTGTTVSPSVVPVPPPPSPPAPTGPARVGSHIAAPKKIKEVRPVYPPVAQAAKITGTVVIDATIGTDGKVANARVIKSIPLLDHAALDAVRQWQFTPTRLNGVPVPVIMTVMVTFTLQ